MEMAAALARGCPIAKAGTSGPPVFNALASGLLRQSRDRALRTKQAATDCRETRRCLT